MAFIDDNKLEVVRRESQCISKLNDLCGLFVVFLLGEFIFKIFVVIIRNGLPGHYSEELLDRGDDNVAFDVIGLPQSVDSI